MRKRGDSYDQEAIDTAFSLYCQGLSHEKIEKEMRKVYPGWSRQLLYDRKTPLTPLDKGEIIPPDKGGIKGGFYPGWITRFNWEERRAEADRKKREREDRTANIQDVFLEELLDIKEVLNNKIKNLGQDVDNQLLFAYRDLIKLIMEQKEGRDSYGDAVRVMDSFTRYLQKKEKDREMLSRIGDHIQGFFETVKNG